MSCFTFGTPRRRRNPSQAADRGRFHRKLTIFLHPSLQTSASLFLLKG